MGGLRDGLGPGTGIATARFEITDDILVSSDKKIYFRDSGIYLQSDSNGNLLIKSDTGIAIEADGSGDVIKFKLADKNGTSAVIVEDNETFPTVRLDSAGDVEGRGKIGGRIVK
jgi:hypothetical protein